MRATLVLKTGRVFTGESFGAQGETLGEAVFCTALTGYQEILTDPSYQGQIVVMTYPHIGNYGVHDYLNEAQKPFALGFVAREFSDTYSHWGSPTALADFMKVNGVVGLHGIDTRALTRHLRDQGACMGLLATGEVSPKTLLAKLKNAGGMEGRDLVKEVTCGAPYQWPQNGVEPNRRVVLMDFGVKRNILNSLSRAGCAVTVVPASATAKDILALKPDGVMLSNGPGDPAAVTYAVQTIRDLVAVSNEREPLPLFGICLGHQLLGLALGGKTYKLKFGHRGANHPVKDLTTGRVEVTTQNHGFAVDIDSLAGKDLELTHVNLNDQTVEGFRHKQRPIFSVQYHPEASPGPHDARYLFKRFVDSMKPR